MRNPLPVLTILVCVTTASALAPSPALAQSPTDPGLIGQAAVGICNKDTTPGPYDVLIYSDWLYKGTCARLRPGLYPDSAHFGLPNDSISAIKIGSAVRARLFWDYAFGGGYTIVNADNSGLGSIGWNDTTSSLRVELRARAENCWDVGSGEVALWRDANWQGDCIVLRADRFYDRSIDLGIANDTVSSLWNSSSKAVWWCLDEHYDWCIDLEPGHGVSSAGVNFQGYPTNDDMTSMRPASAGWLPPNIIY